MAGGYGDPKGRGAVSQATIRKPATLEAGPWSQSPGYNERNVSEMLGAVWKDSVNQGIQASQVLLPQGVKWPFHSSPQHCRFSPIGQRAANSRENSMSLLDSSTVWGAEWNWGSRDQQEREGRLAFG